MYLPFSGFLMRTFLIIASLLSFANASHAGAGGAERVEELIRKLDSTDTEARLAIIEELAELGPRAGKAAAALADVLRESDADLRLNAAIALGKIGKEGVGPVTKLLEVADAEVRAYALTALGWIGPAARSTEPRVLKALKDKADGVRAKAAFALGRIDADPKLAVKPLLKLLVEKNDVVRLSAGEALGRFKVAAVPGLGDALQDDWKTIRLEAARALGEIGPEARSVVGKFQPAITGPDGDVADEALRALVKIGPDAVKTYRIALDHERDEVRQRAVVALESMGAKAAPFLADGLSAKSLTTRRQVAGLLSRMGLKEDVLVPALSRALAEKDRELRLNSLHALMPLAVGAQSAVPAILETLKEKDADIRIAALTVLREIPIESMAIVDAVHPFARDENETIQRLAREVLSFQGKRDF